MSLEYSRDGADQDRRRAPMPRSVRPMLATVATAPFDGPDWLFETKLDGYRAICYIERPQIRFVSRGGIDLAQTFPELVKARDAVDAEEAILDGEVVALDEQGVPRFQLLQNATGFGRTPKGGSKQPTALVYYAFDLIYYNGRNLADEPLIERKKVLQGILRDSPLVRYNDHVEGSGIALFKLAVESGLEGIMAKRRDSRYEQRRSRNWVKIKATRSLDAVIGGYTEGRGSRGSLGALVLGLYRDGELHYIGHTGTGFTEAMLERVHGLLHPLEVEQSPFVEAVKTNEKAHWVRPELACEVRYTEMTDDERLRAPVFIRMRDDKSPWECTFEQVSGDTAPSEEEPVKRSASSRGAVPVEELFERGELTGDVKVTVDGEELAFTNMGKVYYPDDGFTKGDLIRYYYAVADTILPHLKDRPLVLKRYPDGIGRPFFYQHNVEDAPAFVGTWTSGSEDGSEPVNYALCNNRPTLLYLANLGAVELNPWHSVCNRCPYPDWVVFDLDPGPSVEWITVCRVALAVRDVLLGLELESFAKTSGVEGIHIYVPLKPIYTHEQTTAFAEVVAHMAREKSHGDITLERLTRKRPENAIYLDYLQNGEGKTLAAPYSARAKAGALVSAPVSWDEVARCAALDEFGIVTMPERIARLGDLFAGVLQGKQTLEVALARIGRG